MKTVLDEGYTWFLQAAAYREGTLRIVVTEGFRATVAEDLELPGHTLRGTYRIEPAEHSRHVAVTFSRLVAWQCIDESWTAFDEYEERQGDGSLQVLTRSRYLDYVHAAHGWFLETVGPAKHYRVWTENEVIEVVAFDPPDVRVLSDFRLIADSGAAYPAMQ